MSAFVPTASRSSNDPVLAGRSLPAEQDSAPSQAPESPRADDAGRTGDVMTAAVVFAILGGCVALWMADLSLVIGSLAAVFSGLAGILFADW